MKLNVSPEIERSIQRHLDRGEYSSPEEVLLAALEQLNDYSETVADIDQSFLDEKAGRVHSLRDADATLRKKHGFGPRS